MSTHVQGIRAD